MLTPPRAATRAIPAKTRAERPRRPASPSSRALGRKHPGSEDSFCRRAASHQAPSGADPNLSLRPPSFCLRRRPWNGSDCPIGIGSLARWQRCNPGPGAVLSRVTTLAPLISLIFGPGEDHDIAGSLCPCLHTRAIRPLHVQSSSARSLPGAPASCTLKEGPTSGVHSLGPKRRGLTNHNLAPSPQSRHPPLAVNPRRRIAADPGPRSPTATKPPPHSRSIFPVAAVRHAGNFRRLAR